MTTAFDAPVDIANRALQHVGATRIVAFTDDSKNAAAVAFVYDKLRQAELRRNVWRFAVKKAAIRPLDTTTRLLSPAAWAAGAYVLGNITTHNGRIWIANSSTSGEPSLPASGWDVYAGPMTVTQYDATVSYFAGELVYIAAAPTVVYVANVSDNTQTPPGSQWIITGASSAVLSILYPLGAGPVTQVGTRNVYRLPANYLREAAQSPKEGSTSMLGAPSGFGYSDWTLEGSYLVTRDGDPIIFRFVADMADVPSMDPMFCEGLAARIALEIVEELTQSSEKLSTLGGIYTKFMGDGRTVNAIESGTDEPAIDDYLACRI